MVNTVLCGIFGMITSNAWSYHLVVVVAVHVAVVGMRSAILSPRISLWSRNSIISDRNK